MIGYSERKTELKLLNSILRPSRVYTVVIVCLLGAIKGNVSLLTLACSSQGKQVLGFRVKLCRLMWELYTIRVPFVF